MNLVTALLITSIFLSQVVFSLIFSPLADRHDSYPFHRWALFSSVYKIGEFPILYIHSKDGQTINPPVNFFDFFKKNKHLHFLTGRDYLETWIRLQNSGLQKQADNMLVRLERHFFSKFSSITYEIRVEEVDRLEYLRSRKVRKTVKSYGINHFPKAPSL